MRSFVNCNSFICSFVPFYSFHSFVRFVRLFLRFFVRPFVHSFIHSFIHSLILFSIDYPISFLSFFLFFSPFLFYSILPCSIRFHSILSIPLCSILFYFNWIILAYLIQLINLIRIYMYWTLLYSYHCTIQASTVHLLLFIPNPSVPFSKAVPSKPRHLRSLARNQTTVSLSWTHPHHTGGRRDVYYEIECKVVCQKEQTSCSQDCGSQVVFLPRQRNLSHTKATVTKLFSATAYRLRIYAKNGVSAVAEKEGVPSEFAELEITTLESGIHWWWGLFFLYEIY